MNNNVKGLIAVLVVGSIGYYAYMKAYGSKHKYAKQIIKAGNSSNMAVLHTFGEGYLKEWAKASKRGTTTFTYEGKTYNTQGGKATK
jgi:hypothetical protein